jgi:hypothetical protein
MRRSVGATAAFIIMMPMLLSARNLQIVPTTTLPLQLANNTSAANTFPNQTNGNMGATHISKLDVHSLLYSGSRTKVYAHLMPWFGDPRHMSVGYNSQDPAQIHRQITDMISRGIEGIIIDWYGSRDQFTNTTTLRVMAEVEQHPGFTFAIMVDKGAIKLSSCAGCNPQQALIEQLQYIEHTFFPSPAYMRINGKPVVTNFDVELHYPVDWASAVVAAMSTHPVLLFEDANGFTHSVTGGSYSWVRPSTSDLGLGYMSKFYTAGLQHPRLETIGASYKGFNDTLASWSLNRIMPQNCGRTWLETFAKANSFYNSTNQLDALQLVTWNDYEEGTEVESGIDNCFAVTANLSGSSLEWNISGNENTIDHYVVYVSTDGHNLMPLTTMTAGSRSLNLCSYAFAAGNYVLYVQAVGRPTMRSHMSHAVKYSGQCSRGISSALNLVASPSAVSLTAGTSASSKITLASVGGSFPQALSLSCSNLPSGINCSFFPSSLLPGSQQVSSTLTLSAGSTQSFWLESPNKLSYALWFLPTLGLAGWVSVGVHAAGARPIRRMLLLSVVALGVSSTISCGGASNGQHIATGARNRTFTISVIGNSGQEDVSTPLTLTLP